MMEGLLYFMKHSDLINGPQWQDKANLCALIRFTFNPDSAAMLFHRLLTQNILAGAAIRD